MSNIELTVDAAPLPRTNINIYETNNKKPEWNIAIPIILILTFIPFGIWYGSYKPLENKLSRMKALGPQNCKLELISVTSSGSKSCEIESNCLIVFHSNWIIPSRGIVRIGPDIGTLRASPSNFYAIESYKVQINNLWINHTVCYIDPEDDNVVSLDLKDMEASVSTTSARFVATMVFFIIWCCIMLPIIMFAIAYYGVCLLNYCRGIRNES